MRLSNLYIKTIRDKFEEIFHGGEIYLFGSRVDDSKKGGDIDLYLKVKDHTNLFKNKIRFLTFAPKSKQILSCAS